MNNLEKYIELKSLVDIYYDLQDVRIRTANRLRNPLPSEQTGIPYPKQLQKIEESVKVDIMKSVADEPVWVEFLSKWRGIGPCLGGGLIAGIMVKYVVVDKEEPYALKTKDGKFLAPRRRGIEAFPHISNLWSFCGLAPGQRRKKGEMVNWSPKMKVLCWKIGESFVKQKGYYRKLYESTRRYYEGREDIIARVEKGKKGHIYEMAKRKMVKQFLADLWLAWRKLEGLEVTLPYAVDKLGHGYEEPPVEGDRKKERPKARKDLQPIPDV